MKNNPSIPQESVTGGGVMGPEGKIIPAEIVVGDPLEVNADGYKIHIVKYLDPESREQGDGAIFDLEPHRASTVMRLVDPGYKTNRQVVKGSGWALLVSPEGEVKQVELNADNASDGVVALEEGWVDSFIAGPEGMQVLDMGQPPFQLDYEVPVEQGDANVPAEYWQVREVLTNPSS